jgi:probable rRNA maturation factor
MFEVQIRSDSRYPLNRKRVRLVVEKTLAGMGITSQMTVSILVVGKRQMKILNKQYHEEDSVTDVLSFPYLDPGSSRDQGKFVVNPDEGIPLGDIVVCYPVAVTEAQRKAILVDDEVDFLIDHGLQHLLGHHHE